MKTKKTFLCSLCYNGLLGGALVLGEDGVTFKTGKLTVSPAYRNLALPFSEILELTWKWFLFPFATFRMADGRSHTFLIFNKGRFLKHFEQARSASSPLSEDEK